LFGPRYGGGFLGRLQQQPGISETVIDNYYGDRMPTERQPTQKRATIRACRMTAISGMPITRPTPGQDDRSDRDVADGGFDQGFGGGDSGGSSAA
jgi:hypothetical protein